MKELFVSESSRINCYPELFGDEIFKGLPLFFYAESLFNAGMKQMISVYNGGYFEYLKLDTEGASFLPILDEDVKVTIKTPYCEGVLSYRSACLVVWLFVLEQIANSGISAKSQRKIIDCYDDIRSGYREFGLELFEEDFREIHNLID